MIQITKPLCPKPVALNKNNYKDPENKKALLEASHNKCMYCESKFSHVSYGDVEHIKPKIKYPLEAFKWENLGIVCSRCNVAKLDKFVEETPYINPYVENPEDHLTSVGALLFHKKGSERGEITILDITLNRKELLERRYVRLKELNQTIDRCMRTSNNQLKELAFEALKKESEKDKEYSLLAKNLFILHGI